MLAEAAGAITSAPTFKEQLVHDALEPVLRVHFGAGRVYARVKVGLAALPDWNPEPRGIDVSVLDENARLRIAFELKVDEIGQTLWDMLKMAVAARLPSVERAYVVVAAKRRSWNAGRRAGCRFFPRDPCPPTVVPLEHLMDEYHGDWRDDLTYPARPTRFPKQLELRFVACDEVAAWPGYELRALGVRDAETTDFAASEDGWPAGWEHSPAANE